MHATPLEKSHHEIDRTQTMVIPNGFSHQLPAVLEVPAVLLLSVLLISGLRLPPGADDGLVIPLVRLGLRILFVKLACRLLPVAPPIPASASRSKNSDHSSARLSFVALAGLSGMKSVLSEGVLGVRLNGEMGNLRLPLAKDPCRTRPACSFCSSLQLSNAAMSWRI